MKSSDLLQQEQYYSRLWSTECWGSREPNPDEESRLAAISSLINGFCSSARDPAPTILDVGCGRGWLTHKLTRYGAALGIDPLAASIERARLLFPRGTFMVGTTADLLNQGKTFDLIVCSEVIEHIRDIEKLAFLKTLRDLVTAGGFVIITTPRKELWKAFHKYHSASQPIEDWVTESDLDTLASKSGFEIVARSRAFVESLRLGSVSSWLLRRRVFIQYPSLLRMPPFSYLRRASSIYQIILLRHAIK